MAAQASRRPRRTQEQRRTETRRKLIDAAIQLLLDSGFSGLTLGNVASRARLTTGAVQHHFATKQDLLLGVFDAFFPKRHVQIFSTDMMRLSIPERTNQMIDLYWRHIYGRSDYLAIWELILGTRDHPELRERLKAAQKEIVATAVADLRKVFSDIKMSPESVRQIWTFVASQLRGLALLSLFEEQSVLEKDLSLLKEFLAHLITKRCAVS